MHFMYFGYREFGCAQRGLGERKGIRPVKNLRRLSPGAHFFVAGGGKSQFATANPGSPRKWLLKR